MNFHRCVNHPEDDEILMLFLTIDNLEQYNDRYDTIRKVHFLLEVPICQDYNKNNMNRYDPKMSTMNGTNQQQCQQRQLARAQVHSRRAPRILPMIGQVISTARKKKNRNFRLDQ